MGAVGLIFLGPGGRIQTKRGDRKITDRKIFLSAIFLSGFFCVHLVKATRIASQLNFVLPCSLHERLAFDLCGQTCRLRRGVLLARGHALFCGDANRRCTGAGNREAAPA
jgi:hypothetical protein